METAEQLRIHCTTPQAHNHLMRYHANDLLRLTQAHHVKLFSPDETLETASQPLRDDSCSQHKPHSEKKYLDIAVVQRYLKTDWCGQILVALPHTATTQNVLLRLMPWCSSGSVALTGFQTKGRGRRGAIWQSPIGSVAVSIKTIFPSANYTALTFLQYIAALAVVDAAKREWNIPLRIKWPNDIYKQDDKLGGVLCEGALRNDRFEVIVGVGVNVTNQYPTTCLLDHRTTYGREIFIAHFLMAFERLYNTYRERGFDGELKRMYLNAWMHSGQQLRIGGPHGVRAVVHGLAPNGWVRVVREDNNKFEDLPPDNTSLDMKNSILKKKEVGPR